MCVCRKYYNLWITNFICDILKFSTTFGHHIVKILQGNQIIYLVIFYCVFIYLFKELDHTIMEVKSSDPQVTS